MAASPAQSSKFSKVLPDLLVDITKCRGGLSLKSAGELGSEHSPAGEDRHEDRQGERPDERRRNWKRKLHKQAATTNVHCSGYPASPGKRPSTRRTLTFERSGTANTGWGRDKVKFAIIDYRPSGLERRFVPRSVACARES
jgi:hypothetical protein